MAAGPVAPKYQAGSAAFGAHQHRMVAICLQQSATNYNNFLPTLAIYSPWQLIKGVTGNSVFWVIVRDPAGALGHSSGHIGSPSDRKELGMDPRILHSGPASGMYI